MLVSVLRLGDMVARRTGSLENGIETESERSFVSMGWARSALSRSPIGHRRLDFSDRRMRILQR